MQAFLFLYPLAAYLGESKRYSTRAINYLNEIIHARYRKQDYQVIWLTFSRNDRSSPDRSILSRKIRILPQDKIISCGKNWAHFRLHRDYPDQNYILDQLPPGIERLVIGGFHQWDCVDRVASVAWQRDHKAFVDEDTTDLFFLDFRNIPLIRTDWSLKALGVTENMMQLAREARADKPWFVQHWVAVWGPQLSFCLVD